MEKMKIEVWTDIMCPYCYIGKAHYEKALQQFEHADEVELEWKAFQLNPDLPGKGQGYAVTDYLMNTMGLPEEKLNHMFNSVEKLAKDAGLNFNLPNAIAANSSDAHRLIKLAAKYGQDSKVLSILAKAYFEEAKDYSDHEFLINTGKEVGINEQEIRDMLDSDDYLYEIKQDIQEANNLGFDTVPTFLFDRKQAIVGSEPVDLFVKVLYKSYNNWQAAKNKTELIEIQKGQSCSIDGTCEI